LGQSRSLLNASDSVPEHFVPPPNAANSAWGFAVFYCLMGRRLFHVFTL
jgi:hypothetical protein